MSEVQALAREIAAVERLPLAEALERAQEQLSSLSEYAKQWEQWIDDARRCPLCGSRPA